MKKIIFLLLFVLYTFSLNQTLMTVKTTPIINHLINYNNNMGLSLDWSFRSVLNNSIFIRLISNTNVQMIYNNLLHIYFRGSPGTGSKCQQSLKYCTTNLSAADFTAIKTFYTAINPSLFSNWRIQGGISIQNITTLSVTANKPNNYTYLTTFNTNFQQSVSYIVYQYGMEVDQFVSRKWRTAGYDMLQYLNELDIFLGQAYLSPNPIYMFSGPGVSYASKDWMKNMSLFFNYSNNNSYGYGIFTFEMNYFQNDTDCTIGNLLSQNYLNQRIEDSYGQYTQYFQYNGNSISISNMKIHPLYGKNGVTNTFAAALWALDFTMEFISRGGFVINFETNLSQTYFQSAFTSSSNFSIANTTQVNSLYYAFMVFSIFVSNLSPYYIYTSIYSIISNIQKYNIKVWSITDGKLINILIINKDQNINLSGNVQITALGRGTATYYYFSASTLLDINNFTLSGYTFDNTTTGLPTNGNLSVFKAYPDQNGNYYIPISYAQVAIVTIKPEQPYSTSDQIASALVFNENLRLVQLVIIILITILIN